MEGIEPRAGAGRAGLIASIVIAVAGAMVGAFAAYVSEYGASARAFREHVAAPPLREDAVFDALLRKREEIVQRILANEAEAPPPPPLPIATLTNPRPKIILILDDVGISQSAFEKTLALPGPITLSFLPYATGVQDMARDATAKDFDVMLHLPMEPVGDADPGPQALMTGMSGTAFLGALDWNLSRFDGYVGVNNHMGSKLTTDEAAMKTVLAYLNQRDLFFLDSVTTGETRVRAAAAKTGARIISRDVFIDAAVGNKEAIRQQLAKAEHIARTTGYVIAIAHPRPETLELLGPWLASAPLRGFDLAPVSTIVEQETTRQLMAAAPLIRG